MARACWARWLQQQLLTVCTCASLGLQAGVYAGVSGPGLPPNLPAALLRPDRQVACAGGWLLVVVDCRAACGSSSLRAGLQDRRRAEVVGC